MEQKGKGISIAALVLGIISLVFLCCCIGGIFGVVGIVLAIIALATNASGKGMAIAGLVMSSLSIIVTIIYVAISIPFMSGIAEFSENMDQYVQEYAENGSVPSVLEEMESEFGLGEDWAETIMDAMVEEINEIPEHLSELD